MSLYFLILVIVTVSFLAGIWLPCFQCLQILPRAEGRCRGLLLD